MNSTPPPAAEDVGVILRRRLHENHMSQADASRIFGKSRAWGSQELFSDPKKTLRRMMIDQPTAVEEFARKLGWRGAGEMLKELHVFDITFADVIEETLALESEASIFTFGTLKTSKNHDEVSPVTNVHKMPVIGMAAAGYGSDNDDPEPIAWDYVAPENYRPHMLILQVDGDSMEQGGEVNSLHTGDWIYVDTHLLEPQDNKIFVVYIPSKGVVVKRVRKWPQGWVLVSDNHEYPPFTVDEAQIIGRVYYRQPKGEKL